MNYSALGDNWGHPDPRGGCGSLLMQYTKAKMYVFRCPSGDSIPLRVMRTTPPTPGLTDPHDADDIPASYRLHISNHADVFQAVKITQIKYPSQAILLAEGLPSGYHHIATYENGLIFAQEGRVSSL